MCNATHGIAGAFMSVCLAVSLSVCLHVNRVDYNKIKEICAQILVL